MIHAKPYPLSWPLSAVRTPDRKRLDSRFGRKSGGRLRRLTVADSRKGLLSELDRFEARLVVISSNIQLRQDGYPMSGRREPDDPGVAVFFQRGGKNIAIACDQYRRAADNMKALAVTIESLRRIERHGSSNLFEQAFSGFEALPEVREESHWSRWSPTLRVSPDASLADCESAYRSMAARLHPDLPTGNAEEMVKINLAIEGARKHFEADALERKDGVE